jgi:peptidoglycan/xylan/chitin deacetylase (PgdA/CDA1 family)
VKANVTSGSIILFHDCTRDGTFTLEALSVLLPYLKAQGYEFVTVSELIESEQ